MQIERGSLMLAPRPLAGLPVTGESLDTAKWLQAQEAMSHLIAQTSTDAFVAIDTGNRVIYWNSGAEQLFGWSVEEIVGQSLDLIIPMDKRGGHQSAVRRLSEGHKPRLVGKMTDVIALHRDGREVAIELSLTHWCDEVTGKPAGYARSCETSAKGAGSKRSAMLTAASSRSNSPRSRQPPMVSPLPMPMAASST